MLTSNHTLTEQEVQSIESVDRFLESPAASGITLSQALEIFREPAIHHPARFHRAAREFWRAGFTPWPYIQLQWGKIITPADYVQDRQWWDEGNGGRWIILDDWQQDGIEAVYDNHHTTIAMKGNAGCGKNAFAGIVATAYYDVWDDAVVTMTRDTFKSAVKITFGEVVKWWYRAAVRPLGTVLASRVAHRRRHYMDVINPLSDEGFSGEHTEHVMILLDESTAVRDSIHEHAHTQAAKVIKIFNPRSVIGPSRRTFPKRDPDVDQTHLTDYGPTRCITISGERCTNVKMRCLEKAVGPIGGITIEGVKYAHGQPIPSEAMGLVKPIIPGQVCYDRWKGLANHSDPEWAACMAYGRFPTEDPQYQLIREAWYQRAQEKHSRWRRLYSAATGLESRTAWWVSGSRYSDGVIRRLENILPVKAIGLDPSGSEDGDENALCVGSIHGIRAIHTAHIKRTSEVVAWVIDTLESVYGKTITNGGIPCGVDSIYNPGVCDGLSAKGVRVIECKGNDTPSDPKRFGNKRAERFGWIMDRLNPSGKYDYRLDALLRSDPDYDQILDGMMQAFALPDDEMLLEELSVIERIYKAGRRDRFWVTPKRGKSWIDRDEEPPRSIEPISKTLGRSPDRADALSYMIEATQEVGVDLDEWMSAAWGDSDEDEMT